MWRGQEDFVAISSFYKVRIKMITINGDAEPTVNIIEPNPEPVVCHDASAMMTPEMIILHKKDSHYDLILPQNSHLALEGGLDFQKRTF